MFNHLFLIPLLTFPENFRKKTSFTVDKLADKHTKNVANYNFLDRGSKSRVLNKPWIKENSDVTLESFLSSNPWKLKNN